MTAKIYRFPINRTKLATWYRDAMDIKKATNIIGARVWVGRNVPPEFRSMIMTAVTNNEEPNEDT